MPCGAWEAQGWVGCRVNQETCLWREDKSQQNSVRAQLNDIYTALVGNRANNSAWNWQRGSQEAQERHKRHAPLLVLWDIL